MATWKYTQNIDVVTVECIQHLSGEITKEWKELGRYLKLTDATINQIETDHKNHLKEQIYQMLLAWKQSQGANATNDTLKEALIKANRSDLIHLLPGCPEGSVASTLCTQHEIQLRKYFCTTCDSKICAECAFNSHNNKICDVIKLENLSQEIKARGELLGAELRIAREISVMSRNLLHGKKIACSKINENIRNEICEDKNEMIDKIEKSASQLLHEVDKKEKADEKQLELHKSKIEQNCAVIENLEKHQNPENSLTELRKIIGSRKTVQNVKQELEHQHTKLKHSFDHLYKKLSNNGMFGVLARSLLIGGVMIGSKQLIHLRDERQNSNNVLLLCFDPEDSDKEYWRHSVTVNDHQSPVVMSCVERYNNGVSYVLFAVGNTVFSARPHWKASFSDFLEIVSPLVIDGVDEGAWISNIAVYNSNDSSGNVFLISVSSSSILREYTVTGEILRNVEIIQWVANVRLVAYANDHFAVNGFGHDDIVLVTNECGVVKQNGLIKPPSSTMGMSPVCLIWAGATWLSLWVSDGTQIKWKVVRYRPTGEVTKVCSEGTACNDTNVPVSITRWKNQGYISFSDNTVKQFRLIE